MNNGRGGFTLAADSAATYGASINVLCTRNAVASSRFQTKHSGQSCIVLQNMTISFVVIVIVLVVV